MVGSLPDRYSSRLSRLPRLPVRAAYPPVQHAKARALALSTVVFRSSLTGLKRGFQGTTRCLPLPLDWTRKETDCETPASWGGKKRGHKLRKSGPNQQWCEGQQRVCPKHFGPATAGRGPAKTRVSPPKTDVLKKIRCVPRVVYWGETELAR